MALLAHVRLPKEKYQEPLLRVFILTLVCILAFSVRLFSVLRYESVIHEFDPYFNFRSTKYLIENGFYEFHNWFDDSAWYPLGRIIGGTIYPGLMVSAAFVHWILHALNVTIEIRNVCVFLAPMFAAFTSLVAYHMAKEAKDENAGLIAALLLSVVPGYISRSVAGSFDNEGVAIFALMLSYTLWIKAVKTGSLFWSAMTAMGYFYMVAAWGGYIFIINLIPLYTVVMLFAGRFSSRLYVAYSSFYVMGQLLAMQITFVGFQPVQSSEHMLAFAAFCLLQLHVFITWLRGILEPRAFNALFRTLLVGVVGTAGVVGTVLTLTGYISPFTGRFYVLLDPTYASKHIPIIASVSEHQPTTWASYFFDLHILTFMVPAGMYFCFKRLTDANIFVVLYGITSVYFSGVMVRLMLILAPVACVLGAIGFSSALQMYMRNLRKAERAEKAPVVTKKGAEAVPMQREIATIMAFGVTLLLVFFVQHCTWVTSEAYSSPSIVIATGAPDGSRVIFDDFREAYWWLRQNTPDDAKIMSWWDYGYQLAAMANRTILVDNNTWNNSHIALVGKAMASQEAEAYKIMRRMDVDYVLVLFGGLTGYQSDDINKLLWMVRIAGSTDPAVLEKNYLSSKGDFRVDALAAPALLDSLMYKMCYYRFGQLQLEGGKPSGFDRVRNAEIGRKDFKLEYIEEAYTTEHWLVRIYKVKSPDNRP